MSPSQAISIGSFSSGSQLRMLRTWNISRMKYDMKTMTSQDSRSQREPESSPKIRDLQPKTHDQYIIYISFISDMFCKCIQDIQDSPKVQHPEYPNYSLVLQKTTRNSCECWLGSDLGPNFARIAQVADWLV